MFVIKRIAGYSKGRYMAVGLVKTTANLLEAHTFESKEDAQLMATPGAEVVVPLAEERTVCLTFIPDSN